MYSWRGGGAGVQLEREGRSWSWCTVERGVSWCTVREGGWSWCTGGGVELVYRLERGVELVYLERGVELVYSLEREGWSWCTVREGGEELVYS